PTSSDERRPSGPPFLLSSPEIERPPDPLLQQRSTPGGATPGRGICRRPAFVESRRLCEGVLHEGVRTESRPAARHGSPRPLCSPVPDRGHGAFEQRTGTQG